MAISAMRLRNWKREWKNKVTKSITKAKIIEALKTEKLVRSDWFHQDSVDIKGKCDVCAVGAVLRKMSFEKWALRNGFSPRAVADQVTGDIVADRDEIGAYLAEGDYLSALSCYFEDVSENPKNLVKFVEKNFPDKLRINVDPRSL